MKRTKIIATIGPASQDIEVLKQLFDSGMNIARLNLSHGSHQWHEQVFRQIRAHFPNLSIILDLAGPKIRTGMMKDPINLKNGDLIIITTEEVIGDSKRFSVDYNNFAAEIQPNDVIHINDGIIRLKVLDILQNDIKCEVEAGGVLSSRKGINCSSSGLGLRVPTHKDLLDIEFGSNLETDFFAVSYVRSAEEISLIKKLLLEKEKNIAIISKIEHPDALRNFDQILEVSDGIMIARGDLGIEIPSEDVPIVQKELIHKTNNKGKPVIVATQMLESMTSSPRATRAEVSDVTNAILDGADAVMLSGETATGKYPILTVETMTKIALSTEKNMFLANPQLEDADYIPTEEILGSASNYIAKNSKASALIATSTRTGNTARMVAKHRPKCMIIATTPYSSIMRQLQLSWGVIPLSMKLCTNTDEIMFESISKALEAKLIKKESIIVAIGGSNLGLPGKANLVQVCDVSEILRYKEITSSFH